jgi:hypothetical protein
MSATFSTGVRETVRVAVVGERLDRDVGIPGSGVTEVERRDRAVADELAQPVVCADDDVGALTGGTRSGQVVADLVERDFEHRHLEPLRFGERLGERRQHRCAGVVGPDDEVGVPACRRHELGGGGRTRRGGVL